MNFRFLLLQLLFFFSLTLSANVLDHRYQKTFRIQSLSIEDGLSQSSVNTFFQDENGFIWLGTEDGLNRFDGYEFKIFETKHSDPTSLHNNNVRVIQEDPKRGLWLGTEAGPSFYDYKTQKFTNLQLQFPALKGLITGIGILKSGDVYIATTEGLFFYNQTTKTAQIFETESGTVFDGWISGINIVPSVNEAPQRIFFATSNCAYEIKSPNTIETLCEGDFEVWAEDNPVNAFAYVDERIWLGSHQGLAYYDMKSKTFKEFSAGDGQYNVTSLFTYNFFVDDKNDVWIATNKGINVYRNEEGIFDKYLSEPNSGIGLKGNDIANIYVDNAGLVWLAAYSQGFSILDPMISGFEHIFTQSDLAKYNITNTVHALVKDRNEKLWVSIFSAGIFKFDLMTGEIERPLENTLESNADVEDFTYDFPVGLLLDLHERLWISYENQIKLVDVNTDKLIETEFILNNEPLELLGYTFALYEDLDGGIWIGNQYNLYYVEEIKNNNDKLIITVRDLTLDLPINFRTEMMATMDIVQTSNGDIWLGGTTGIAVYRQSEEKWEHYQYEPNNRQSLSGNDVLSMFEDSRGILWIGTSKGLNKVNQTNNGAIYFDRITKEEGLPNNTIYGILEDNQKQLWLSTNLGIVQFSDNTQSMKSYRQIDGISSDEFASSAYFSDPDGILYFGSINGITIINGHREKPRPIKRNLVFTHVKVGDRILDSYALNQAQEAEITKFKNESTINISVADLYYKKLATQDYRYRILGLDENWINLGKKRNFLLAGLPQGKYYVDIQSKVGDESWSKNTLRLKINVESDFIKSSQAFQLVVVVSLLLIGLFIYFVRKYYAQKMSKYINLIKIEEVRNKDAKKQNSELRSDLEKKLEQISNMQKKINQAADIIESQQFRDTITGFYHFKHITQLLARPLTDKEKAISSFNFVLLFEVDNMEDIENTYGKICAAEVISYAAELIKKHTPAETYICYIKSGKFIVLANTTNNKVLADIFKKIKNLLMNSKVNIANGLTVQPQISLTYIEIYSGDYLNDKNIIALSQLMTVVHQYIQIQKTHQCIRIDINQKLDDILLYCETKSVIELFENNLLSYHII